MKIGYFVDWLEVYCHELEGSDPVSALTLKGYSVEIAPYTTRVYGQVLNVSWPSGERLFTICRLPLSVKSSDSSGILNARSCHIKLHNHLLYTEDVGTVIMRACRDADIVPRSISRIDICADFQYFYNGMNPDTLIRGFASGAYMKLNQPHFSLYGDSSKGFNTFNGATFGSRNSNVFTRFYCKSVEMAEVCQKNWILDCWRFLGFDLEKPVWRVEFEVKGPGRKTVNRETAEVNEIQLSDLCSRDKIRALFLSLSKRYFVFTRAKTATRKSNQERLILFDPSNNIERYQPLPSVHTNTTNSSVKRAYNFLINEMKDGVHYSDKERVDMWLVAHSISLHHSLSQWVRWAHPEENGVMPFGSPVINPLVLPRKPENPSNKRSIYKQELVW